MLKKKALVLQAFLGLYFVAYFISVIISPGEVPGNLLPPLGALAAFGILLYTFRTSGSHRLSWLMSALACLSCAVTFILLDIYEMLLGTDPGDQAVFICLYALPKVFIALAVGMFFVSKVNDLNRVQLLFDVIATIVVVLSLIWIVFFENEFELLLGMSLYSVSTFLYMLFDLFSLILIFIIYSSLRRGSTSIVTALFTLGVITYTSADLYYARQVFKSAYSPSPLLNTIYIVSLLLVASSGLWVKWDSKFASLTKSLLPENIGPNHKSLFLLFAPVVVILLKGLDLRAILFLSSIVIMHQIISVYVQGTIKNAYLLKQEKNMTDILEKLVLERTQELTAANLDLEKISKQDMVTGLCNRRYFLNELDRMINEVKPPEAIVLFFLDLDRFKAINDSYGHDMGDRVLIEIAGRLNGWKPQNSMLARLGGDEFVFAFQGQYGRREIEEMAEKIIKLCNKPVIFNPYRFHLTLSIGITIFPEDALERSTLMKNADIAMYHSKSQGYNQYAFFSSLLSDRVRRNNEIEILLRKADYDSEFMLYYQPQFSIPDDRLIGVEALLRWKSPEQGMISPEEFIPIAEEIGSIVPIGEWVMKEAVRQISVWNKKYGLELKMGINISTKQLDSLNFMDLLQSLINMNKIKAQWLDIEITESHAMKVESKTEEILSKIADVGVTISIDDFGTGYSSLSYIKRFAIDRLKIAKPLVDSISTDYSEIQIVKAIVMMAKAMDIGTIAEGVESDDQLRILKELGCNEVQGYYYSCPLPAQEFEKEYLHQVL